MQVVADDASQTNAIKDRLAEDSMDTSFLTINLGLAQIRKTDLRDSQAQRFPFR